MARAKKRRKREDETGDVGRGPDNVGALQSKGRNWISSAVGCLGRL